MKQKKFDNKKRHIKSKKNNIDRNNETHVNKGDSGALIRLNKFIAHAGICSRREADQLILTG